MQVLKEKILRDGELRKGNILKVDSFLNHQIDVLFLEEIGEEFKRRFAGKRITKVITLEASGIAVAAFTALKLKVPCLFAKKTESLNLDPEQYVSEVFSYTKNQAYRIRVSKRFLAEDDAVLIIDDFLAKGSAVDGLMALCHQAKASVVGVGAVIEKGFQEGGDRLRASGIQVESLAIVEAMDVSTGIHFRRGESACI